MSKDEFLRQFSGGKITKPQQNINIAEINSMQEIAEKLPNTPRTKEMLNFYGGEITHKILKLGEGSGLDKMADTGNEI